MGLGINTITCTLTDQAGNVGTASFTVTMIEDDFSIEGVGEAPLPDTTLPDTTPPVVWAPVAGISVDIEGTNADIHYNGLSVSLGENGCRADGQPEATCSQYAKDRHGDFDGVKETLTFLVNVTDDADTTSVVPSCSDGIAEGVVSTYGASGWWHVHFFGYVGTTSFSNATGTWLVGTQSFQCIASDAAGNTGSTSFVVKTYYQEADTTPPVVTVPSDQTFIVTQEEYDVSYYPSDGHYYPQFFAWTATSPDAVPRGSQSATAYCNPTTGIQNGQFSGDNHSMNFQLGTTTVTCTAVDAAGNEGSASFTVTVVLEEAADTFPPTVTATAYLNATSPTGRTLHLTYDGLCNWLQQECTVDDATIGFASIRMPDASIFQEVQYGQLTDYSLRFCTAASATASPASASFNQCADRYYMPIPEDWVSGTYEIIMTLPSPSTTTVTIPALTSDTFPPTVTATAYLNATSPTGRTLHLATNGLASCPTFPCIEFGGPDGYIDYDIYLTALRAWIRMPDGSTFTTPNHWADPVFNIYFSKQQPNWDRAYMPIPVDWVAGIYDIIWYDQQPQSSVTELQFDVTTAVTVPALPALGDEPIPTVTATAYANSKRQC